MIDFLISRCNKINWADKKKTTFQAAHIFGKAELILFSKIPKGHEQQIEEAIEEILEHGMLHIILANRIGKKESTLYDRIFPLDTDLREWMEN
jgi:methylmalonyl-CoA mutase cobalamin-binding subunit